VDASDGEQFDEFMASRWPGLVRLAFGLTGDRWLAEDLTQTALAKAYAAWWRVRRADDPDAYVLPGYAGLVTQRAAKVVVSVDNGTDLTITPVSVAGRAYLAFAVPPGCRPYLLTLFDAAGHPFATSTAMPPAK
jgi:hypothetical protein